VNSPKHPQTDTGTWKWVPKAEVVAYLQIRGLTLERAKANIMRRGYSEQKALEELQVGPLCEQVLELFKKHVHEHPEECGE
jgi:hypothetical protein